MDDEAAVHSHQPGVEGEVLVGVGVAAQTVVGPAIEVMSSWSFVPFTTGVSSPLQSVSVASSGLEAIVKWSMPEPSRMSIVSTPV